MKKIREYLHTMREKYTCIWEDDRKWTGNRAWLRKEKNRLREEKRG